MLLPSNLTPTTLEPLLFSLISSAPTLRHLRQSHALLLRLGLHHNSYLLSKFLRRLSDLGAFSSPYPTLIFSQVPNPNSFLWTSLIRAHSLQPDGGPHRSLLLYSQMRRHCSPPLSFTFSALLKSFRTLSAGTQVHTHIIRIGGFDADLFVNNTLIDFYLRCGQLDLARKVFDEMPVRDLISWTSLIVAYSKAGDMGSARGLFDRSPEKDMVAWTAMVTGYTQNAMPREALEAFDKMREAKVAIDEVAVVGVISAVAQLGGTSKAKWVGDVVGRSGIKKNVVVGSAMVDMYTKCGLIDEARNVFDETTERNVYTFSAMIVGLASHGRALEAIELFSDMTKSARVEPNRVTFIGVLTACSHAGLVAEGRHYFHLMKDEYGIAPDADHYACMVDLLGRAGLVEEALELIRLMVVRPHGGVWGALLGACRIHGKPEIACIAASHLFELEPDGIGNYILLSNIYASAGMWDDVSKVRRLMRDRGLRKNPASSWTESRDGAVHGFFAGDDTHPKSREIKEALVELIGRLRVAGYEPVLSSVVYDVSDDKKERVLMGHSEKLALAFGLLTTELGSTIRITKNVRICEDCHLVMQFASNVVGRQIVVRDNMRFHHFKDGKCSCGEFW